MVPMHECINYLLSVAQHNVNQYLSQKLACYDLTPSQYSVLDCLWVNGGCCTPKQMADRLFIENSTISGILDRLQKKELLDRVINADNRREVLVTLTEKGRELEIPIHGIIDEINERVLADFSKKEIEDLKHQLRIIGEKNL